MNAKRKLLFQTGAVVLLLLIAGAMFIIGRGHTVYLDSRSMEYNGQTYAPPYKIVVYVDGEQVAKLYDKERGMATCIGPKFTMSLEITQTKGGSEETTSLSLRLPHNMDGIIFNLPALLAGLPEEAYLSEFISTPAPVSPEEELPPTDGDLFLPEEGVLPAE